MLKITVPAFEGWDEKKEEFVHYKEQKLELEHSLVSLSKWESKWQKPFLNSEKSPDEIVDYIKCMTLTQNVEPGVYNRLSRENVKEINAYIESPMTATTFGADGNKSKNREIITAEIIYYWMIALQIPFECQKWHLNRLLTLIRVCNIKNQPAKKQKKADILRRNAQLNAMRRAKTGSKG